MKALEKHFGAVVATVRDLHISVGDLKRKFEGIENGELKEIVEAQRVMEEVVVANSEIIHKIKKEGLLVKDAKGQVEAKTGEFEFLEKHRGMHESITKNGEAIKMLDKEIKHILEEKSNKEICRKELDDAITTLNEEIIKIQNDKKENKVTGEVVNTGELKKEVKKCKYNNTGYCKYKSKCRFRHPQVVCKDIKCKGGNECEKRHPKACKWTNTSGGCKIKHYCAYSHDTSVCGDEGSKKNLKCISCQHKWSEEKFVVKHTIKNIEVYFCLNCEDWVKEKERVFEEGWSLFDKDGYLNYNL